MGGDQPGPVVAPASPRSVPMVIEAQFLTDRVMAALRDDRQASEWPLHPGRLFNAAVSALHGIEDDDAVFADSEAAIRWFETLGPPVIHAAPGESIATLQNYVPINDEAVLTRGKARGKESSLPDSPWRRRGRVFPGVSVHPSVIRYAWRADPDALRRHRQGIQEILCRIPYLGRSVNFVLMRLLETEPGELPHAALLHQWTPSNNGTILMRTFSAGRLDELRGLYGRGIPADRGTCAFYRDPFAENSDQVIQGPWNSVWTSFAAPPGWAMRATDTEECAKAFRHALIRAVRNGAATTAERETFAVDPFISGHEADGSPTRINRLAIVPLSNVMNEHADGRILGFAVLMPTSATPEQWRLVSDVLFGDEERGLAPLSEIRLGRTIVEIRHAEQRRPFGLAPDRYVVAASKWTTITPILLSRRPDSGSRAIDPETLTERVIALVAKDCAAAGLPEPVAIEVSAASEIDGVARAKNFVQRRNGPQRWSTHATITFGQPVMGPLLVGAGRYNGLGLLTPAESRERAGRAAA